MQRSLHFKELYIYVLLWFYSWLYSYIYKINKKKCAKYLLLITITLGKIKF